MAASCSAVNCSVILESKWREFTLTSSRDGRDRPFPWVGSGARDYPLVAMSEGSEIFHFSSVPVVYVYLRPGRFVFSASCNFVRETAILTSLGIQIKDTSSYPSIVFMVRLSTVVIFAAEVCLHVHRLQLTSTLYNFRSLQLFSAFKIGRETYFEDCLNLKEIRDTNIIMYITISKYIFVSFLFPISVSKFMKYCIFRKLYLHTKSCVINESWYTK